MSAVTSHATRVNALLAGKGGHLRLLATRSEPTEGGKPDALFNSFSRTRGEKVTFARDR
mgnify:FL=1